MKCFVLEVGGQCGGGKDVLIVDSATFSVDIINLFIEIVLNCLYPVRLNCIPIAPTNVINFSGITNWSRDEAALRFRKFKF